MLTDNRWDGIKGMHRAEVDFLYVCRGYHGSLHELSRLFNPRCVVLDASCGEVTGSVIFKNVAD